LHRAGRIGGVIGQDVDIVLDMIAPAGIGCKRLGMSCWQERA
jgi:hypothetical protein